MKHWKLTNIRPSLRNLLHQYIRNIKKLLNWIDELVSCSSTFLRSVYYYSHVKCTSMYVPIHFDTWLHPYQWQMTQWKFRFKPTINKCILKTITRSEWNGTIKFPLFYVNSIQIWSYYQIEIVASICGLVQWKTILRLSSIN